MIAWTYGAELEWPDVDVIAELPDGWAWSRTDYTVVNSDGVANDPLRRLVLRGGELNTPACGDATELAQRVNDMRIRLRPGYNYRSNLHLHIGGIAELEDLGQLKQAAAWLREMLPRMLPYTDPLDGLLTGLEDPAEIAAAEKRKRHSERSRHYFISDAAHARRMEARTAGDFMLADMPVSRDGIPQPQLAPREAVNFRSLHKHGTVEFRCFAGDENAENVLAAAWFAQEILRAALNGTEMFAIPHFFDLPVQAPFSGELEQGWAWTNFQHNKRAVVEERLRDLGKLPEQACSS